MIIHSQEINNSLYRRWSVDAANCYNRKFKCDGCLLAEYCQSPIAKNIYGIAAMKYSVLKLFAQHGEPPEFLELKRELKNDRFF